MEKISVAPRKWLLTLHLLFSAIMLGNAVAFLILSLTAAAVHDAEALKATYASMHVLARTSVRASTIGAVVTGVLLSVLTRWGLFRFYWIIAKEALAIVAIGLGPFGMYFWTLKAGSSWQLWSGIVVQILTLASLFVISVFKPWGQRQRKN
ncbi:hypothetical protein E5161_09350 [Cohnella pontilimi]|uniref:DUF2269 family protein n=1 Tax=Cohnella pontilimi TaxID=2564100 RepID=A0A4U0FBP3_9BACL|nr:hypothetical protein [Cohnella pontilimi]TJY42205.1 hypothetical protein E5161_09350 [Cohnella pontilimi]